MTKKRDFIQSLREQTEAELEKNIRELQTKLQKIKMEQNFGELIDVHTYKKERKKLAQALTEKRNRQL